MTVAHWDEVESHHRAKGEIDVRAGHLVARPPATQVSHSFRDMCFYPRSNKLAWRGLGVVGRVEHLEYGDGEPVEDD